jgi:hypothetical protein
VEPQEAEGQAAVVMQDRLELTILVGVAALVL